MKKNTFDYFSAKEFLKSKKILSTGILTGLILSSFSCTQDDLSSEELSSLNGKEDQISTVQICEYTQPDVEQQKVLSLDCLMDLKGKRVVLNENLRIDYQGGSFINGTLVVTSPVIDSRILGSNIKVDGAKSVNDDIFEFIPSHWDIVEGPVSDAVALNNREKIEEALRLADEMNATTFKIDEIDAYFLVSRATYSNNFYSSREAINIPGGMNFLMSEDTHLRVQPNSNPRYALLAVRDASDVTIKGGNLYGDRDEHTYTGGTHEWGHVIEIHGAHHVTVDGVTVKNGSGDGIKIHSLNFTFQENYKPAYQILVKNCILDSNRRNNLAITDGYDMIIEKNTFLRAGIDMPNSQGTAPKFQIDIEPYRERNEAGNLVEYEIVKDIIVRNNIEKETGGGGFVAYSGSDILFENNTMEKGISWQYASKVSIKNNKFIGSSTRVNKSAIVGGRSNNDRTSFGNIVSGNEIRGYETGITIYGRENRIYANRIFQCDQGIFLRYVNDSRIYSNTIESSKDGSKGIFAHMTTVNNVSIYNHKVKVESDAYKFVKVNHNSEDQNNKFSVYNNSFTSNRKSNIENTFGLTFKNNKLSSSLMLTSGNKMTFEDNEMITSSSTGFDLRGVNKDIVIADNTIDVKDGSNSNCIKIASSTSSSEVEQSNNQCDR